MNKVILMGRAVRDAEIRYGQNESNSVAKYTLAVDRRIKGNDNEQNADFINIVAFGKGATFAEKFIKKGTKLVVTGRIQTGSYTNKDGQKVYTTDVIVEEQEFAESKNASQSNGAVPNGFGAVPNANDLPLPNNGFQPVGIDVPSFLNVPDNYENGLPFAPPTAR